MAFEIASTNLVIELGVILALLMGWQFTLAEFIGGPLMIVASPCCSGSSCGPPAARGPRAGRPRRGRLDGGPRRDGHVGPARRLVRAAPAIPRGLHLGEPRVRDGVGRDHPGPGDRPAGGGRDRRLGAGRLLAGFFFSGHPLAAKLWGPLIGPVVAIISFVCSIGNVPLAVVLWKGGISFGGVVAFIFADLIIAPILNIYRKYYGRRMAAFLLATFFAAMALAGYAVELVFGGLGLIPPATAKIPDQGVSWDYTTWLNIVFLILAAGLITRFVRTGGADAADDGRRARTGRRRRSPRAPRPAADTGKPRLVLEHRAGRPMSGPSVARRSATTAASSGVLVPRKPLKSVATWPGAAPLTLTGVSASSRA